MKLLRITCFLLFLHLASSGAWATPTSLFWTNCTTEVQATGVGHLGVDNYFTVFNRRGHSSYFNPDVGFTLGLFEWNDLKAEAGIDYLGGADDPLFFNTKIGIAEGKVCEHFPSFSVGIFDIGTRTKENRTNLNVVDVVFGKSLPECIGGTLYIGAYAANKAIGRVRQGFMIGYTRSFCPKKYCDDREYNKWVLNTDFASGKNAIGGGGIGIAHFFTPDISILTGPVWFTDADFNGQWKWSIQLDIDFTVFDAPK